MTKKKVIVDHDAYCILLESEENYVRKYREYFPDQPISTMVLDALQQAVVFDPEVVFDHLTLLIRTLDSSRKDNESCAIFEDNDVQRERMLQEAADLKVLIAFFEDLIT